MITATNGHEMVPVIAVDEDKCVNCHMCIAVCPVKYCIEQLRTVSIEVGSVYTGIASEIAEILSRIGTIAAISSKTQETIASMNHV